LKNVGNQAFDGPCIISIPTMEVDGSQWGPSTVWLPTFFKMYSFVFGRRKKFIQD